MATYATLTVPVEDIIGADYDPRRTAVHLETNTPNSLIVVDGTSLRVGGRREKLGDSGTVEFANLVTTNSADNPTSFAYRVQIVYTPIGSREQKVWTSSDFTFTATANLANISEAFDGLAIAPTWQSDFRDEMEAIAGLTGEDAAIANRINTGGSLTDVALVGKYATLDGLGRQPVRKDELVYNVKDYASLTAALTAVPSGASIYLPAGTYTAASVAWPTKDITLIGDGPRKTIIQASGAYGIVNPTIGPATLTFRNLGITGGSSAMVRLTASAHVSATFIDCRFSGFTGNTHYGIENNGVGLKLVRCEFDGQGIGKGTAVYLDYGADVDARDCTFRYMFRGIYAVDTNAPPRSVTVDASTFDGGWAYLLPYSTGTGTTYTATTVTSTGKFTSTAANHTIRALATKNSGTATVTARRIEDLSANFTSSGVKQGDIVRMAAGWGIVSRVISATRLTVEEWLTLTDYQQTSRPTADGGSTGSYTVQGLVIGKVTSTTADTATVNRWRDWVGNDVTPTNGTAFEACVNTDYQLFVLSGEKVKITNNVLKRAWADQISLQRCVGYPQVIGNQISDGQDVGITIEDAAVTGLFRGVTVANNTIAHQGSAGIFFGRVYESICDGNMVANCNWLSASAATYAGGVQVETASNLSITNNRISQYDSNPNALKAIHLSGTTTGVVLTGNRSTNIATTLLVTGAAVTGHTGVFPEGTTIATASSGTGPIGDFTGSGVPTVIAASGSTYRRRGGAASATFYVMEAGSWVAK